MRENPHRRGLTPRMLAPAAVVFVALLLLCFCGRWLEKQMEKPQTRGNPALRQAYEGLYELNGGKYSLRSGITSILLMGIDRETVAASGFRNGGQADFLRLLVLDSEQKTLKQLQIDRDTMAEITILGVLGEASGTRRTQIGLSHGFGDGGAQSCELSMKAVSGLLGGIPIDFYLALNIDGIAALNDALGGVTVTLAEDLSALDPAMVPGATLQLTGTQAELYLRGRRGAGSGTNRERMARQQIYLSQLADLLDAKLQADANFAGELYDVLEPYLSTNLSRGRLINEIWAARDYERADLIEPEGSYKIAPDGFVEFFADQEQMHKYAAELFCMPFP